MATPWRRLDRDDAWMRLGVLLISSHPPIDSARSLRPLSPNPRLDWSLLNSNPGPLSRISIVKVPPASDTSTLTSDSGAYLPALVSASCTMRYAASLNASGSASEVRSLMRFTVFPVRLLCPATSHSTHALSP